MTDAIFYGFLGAGITLCCLLLLLAVDLATRGPQRRAMKRLRKQYRAPMDCVGPSLPVIRRMRRRR